MAIYRFNLSLPAHELKRYYRGEARQVIAIDEQGRRVQFPAEVLRPFIDRQGVIGRFEMQVDDKQKLIGFWRIDRGIS